MAFTLARLPNAHVINLELSALEAEGKGKVISSPRLITSNQAKARIEQGQEGLFRALSGGAGTTTFVVRKAVLALEVTPQITPDERIIMDVSVTKDRFSNADTGLIDKKEIKTQVLLNNGETIVIGGIYEQTETSTNFKVPFFGDLPLVGWMFRKKTSRSGRATPPAGCGSTRNTKARPTRAPTRKAATSGAIPSRTSTSTSPTTCSRCRSR